MWKILNTKEGGKWGPANLSILEKQLNVFVNQSITNRPTNIYDKWRGTKWQSLWSWILFSLTISWGLHLMCKLLFTNEFIFEVNVNLNTSVKSSCLNLSLYLRPGSFRSSASLGLSWRRVAVVRHPSWNTQTM